MQEAIKIIVILAILKLLFILVANVKMNRDYKKMGERYCNCYFDKVTRFAQYNINSYPENTIVSEQYSLEYDTLSESTAVRYLQRRFDILKYSLAEFNNKNDSYAEERAIQLLYEFEPNLLKISEIAKIDSAETHLKVRKTIASSLCMKHTKPTFIMKLIKHNRAMKFRKNGCGIYGKF